MSMMKNAITERAKRKRFYYFRIHLKDDFSRAIKADPDETDAKWKF